MRIGRYRSAETDTEWLGVKVSEGHVINLTEAGDDQGVDLPTHLTELFTLPRWKRTVTAVVEQAEVSATGRYHHDEIERLAPIVDPQKVVCVGLNYSDHAEEGDNPIPDEPVLFAKFPTTITGPGQPIRWDPGFTDSVDYEAELVVAIGSRAKRRSRDEAMDAVAGYLVGNDVSARDIQHGDGQWVRGKSLDTFAPIGPELVTTDEIDDPHTLDIWSEVNGERRQASNTSNLIFDIGELVSFCSQAFTLLPGDLLFTGTPPGVGIYRDPPALLTDGDTVTIGVEGIGTLTNPCEHESVT